MTFLLGLLVGVPLGAGVWARFGRRICAVVNVLTELSRDAVVRSEVRREISEGHPPLGITKRVREMTDEFNCDCRSK